MAEEEGWITSRLYYVLTCLKGGDYSIEVFSVPRDRRYYGQKICIRQCENLAPELSWFYPEGLSIL